MSAHTEMRERREHKRVVVELAGILVSSAMDLAVSVKDVSAGSALVEVPERLPHGALLTLKIDKLGAFDCQQRWWIEDGRTGIEFV